MSNPSQESKFTVTANDAARIRDDVRKRISNRHIGIDGTYEEGVIDAIAWLLGEQPFIAYDGWLNEPRKSKERPKGK